MMNKKFNSIFLSAFITLYIFFAFLNISEAKQAEALVTISLSRPILKMIAKSSLGQESEKIIQELKKDNQHIKSFSFSHVDSSVILTFSTENYQFLQSVTSIPKEEMKINIACNKFTLYRMAMAEYELEEKDIKEFSVSGSPAKFKIIAENNFYHLFITYSITLPPEKVELTKEQIKEAIDKKSKTKTGITEEKPHIEENTVYVYKIESAPAIDGKETDKIWENIPFYSIVLFGKSDIKDIQVKAGYTGKNIYFLFKWKDPTNNYYHKVWIWDKKKNSYTENDTLEDRLVLKFGVNTDFSACPEEGINSKADIWDWRAALTNSSGYADNKKEIISLKKIPRSYEIKIKNNNKVWLQYLPDKGTAPYRQEVYTKFTGDTISQFINQKPSEDRADILASGFWDKDYWITEFCRLLEDSDKNDVQFDPKNVYYFAIAVYNHSELDIHNYSKKLTLKFKQ